MKGITLDIQHSSAQKKRGIFNTSPTLRDSAPPFSTFTDKKIAPVKQSKSNRKRVFKKIALTIVFLGVAIAVYIIYRGNRVLNFMGINTNPVSTISNVITQKEPELKKDNANRTNLLIVGLDTRPSNPGLQNTDTIMIASFNHKTKDTILISFPRDILVAYPDNEYYFTKINAIFNYCERQNTGTGMQCLSETVKSITGLSIQYTAMVDISGMVEIIDTIGGVDIDVERAFTDYMFPTEQNTYETIHFDAGMQHMDGTTAMKYSRSRHAQSVEGSDYARARRQQKVVIAAKDKLLTLDTLKNPLTVVEIMKELGESISVSEITTEDIRAAIALSDDIKNEHIYTVVLDPMLGNWQLIGENPAGPKAGLGDWSAVTTYLSLFYEHPILYSLDKSVYIYNAGLGYEQTYQKYLSLTQTYPYLSIVFGGNSALQDISGTHIYNFDTKPNITFIEEYASFYNAEWTSITPEGLTPLYGENIAILFGAEQTETAPKE